MAAFVLCAVLYVAGEWVSTVTKAWIPSVFVTACLMLLCYWHGLPHDVVTDAKLLPWGASMAIFLLIVHMGTIISFKQLMEQWKVVVVALASLFGMCVAGYFICPLFMDRAYVIAGLPPLTGGIVAATIMNQAAVAKGMTAVGVFAIAMYCVQGFAGYPLTAIFLQSEGRRLIGDFRSGKTSAAEVDTAVKAAAAARRKLLPPLPKKFDSAVVILLKLGLIGYLATLLGGVSFGPIGKISGAIWCLLLGVIFTSVGFLDENSLVKANSFGILMFALMMFIFDGLKDCTPAMLGTIITPLVVLIAVGVAGQLVAAAFVSKLVGLSVPLGISVSLTALYGFPPNAVLTESTCKAIAQNEEEMNFLMGEMMPPMLVGGFTTVTITSVFIAGIFAKLF
ncbi:MAG: hypothetical protein J6Z30_01965 [Pyramidobacter sp.]|nr:hypothetical protein [Pyramidobacter sp.]